MLPKASAALAAMSLGLAILLAPSAALAQRTGNDEVRPSTRSDRPAPEQSEDGGAEERGGGDRGGADRGNERNAAEPKASPDGAKDPSTASAPASPNARPREQGIVMRADRPELLGQTELVKQPPHPAAAAHPGHDVTVCVAGCGGERDKVIYMRKKTATEKPAAGQRASPHEKRPPA